MANVTKKKDHPVSESVGAAGGAIAGMTAGAAAAGPAGAVVGAAIGAVAGGVAGHGVAEAFELEDEYWRVNYRERPYVTPGADYSRYRDAYRYGWKSRTARRDDWDDAQNDLERGWEKAKATSRLGWSEAKEAVRDGWHHVERALPGDADRDGR
jgi:uncharacterized protein YcfJ